MIFGSLHTRKNLKGGDTYGCLRCCRSQLRDEYTLRTKRMSFRVSASGLAITFAANCSIKAAGQKARFSNADKRRIN